VPDHPSPSRDALGRIARVAESPYCFGSAGADLEVECWEGAAFEQIERLGMVGIVVGQDSGKGWLAELARLASEAYCLSSVLRACVVIKTDLCRACLRPCSESPTPADKFNP